MSIYLDVDAFHISCVYTNFYRKLLAIACEGVLKLTAYFRVFNGMIGVIIRLMIEMQIQREMMRPNDKIDVCPFKCCVNVERATHDEPAQRFGYVMGYVLVEGDCEREPFVACLIVSRPLVVDANIAV